ncbi:MAG: hypothetical protein IPJ65_17280 [Archangiaceae bacterium]|nr:hypothetical protein [Archangiaceae bacterium]
MLCALLAIVVAGAQYLIERDRERLAEKFAAERLLQVEEAADLSRRDLDGVAVVLRLAGRLIEGTDRTEDLERELRALLAASEQFRALAVYGPEGKAALSVSNPRAATDEGEPAIEAQMRDAARRSLSRAGELELSSPLSTAAGRSLRVVAISPGTSERPRAVAMLIDSERLFSKLRLLASDPALRLLLLGPHGRPSSSSDALIAAASTGASSPALSALLTRLRRGERGTLWMSGADAGALGMGDADVLCAFAPLATDGLGQWSLALLTSTSVLRSAERSLAERLVVAAAAICLLLIAFGVFVVIVARRSAVTGERLLHAERVAHLHERTREDARQHSRRGHQPDRRPSRVVSQPHAATAAAPDDVPVLAAAGAARGSRRGARPSEGSGRCRRSAAGRAERSRRAAGALWQRRAIQHLRGAPRYRL